jgi:ketosteroid isomerase-like protein
MNLYIISLMFLPLLGISIVSGSSASAQGATDSAREAVLRVEQEWQDALVTADVKALDRIYADSMIYTHSNGSVDDKTTYIENLRLGKSVYKSMTRDEIKVQIFGDAAIVTCHWRVNSVSGATVNNTNARYLHFYTKMKGKWRMVAHQATRIIQ